LRRLGRRGLSELRARLSGTFIRYTKADVATQLPPIKRHRIPLEDPNPVLLEKYQKAELDIKGYLRDYAKEIYEDSELNLGGMVVKLGKQRGPGAWRITAMTTMMGLLSEIKRERAVYTVLDVLNRHDLVVAWTYRVASAEALVAQLRALDPTGSSIEVLGPVSGKMPQEKRRELATQLAACKGRRAVYVATIGSAGTCINDLVSASASVFVDLWWRPSDLLQAEARIHREGQVASLVEAYYLVVPNTLDDYILTVLEDKAQAAASISPYDKAGLHLTAELTPSSASADGEPDLDAICKILQPLLQEMS